MNRPGVKRTVTLLAAGLLLVLAAPALGQSSPRPSGRTPSPTAVAAPQAALTITDLLPRAPRPGDPFQVLGTVANTSTTALKSVQVRVLVGTRIDSRGRLAQADRSSLTYTPKGRAPTPVAETLAVGADAPVDLRMAVDELDLGDDGIYPLRIQVRELDERGNRIVVAEQNTYLPWFADGKVDPLRLAWVLPLVDQPHRGPDEQFVDDDLAGALAAEGRLGRALSAGRAAEVGSCAPEPQAAVPTQGTGAPGTAPVVPAERLRCDAVPVTFSVDPELLDEAQAMTAPGGYATARGPGTGTAAATAWLDGLRQAGQRGADLLALPFADPDVVAMTGGDGTLTADLAVARTYGTTLTTDLLAKAPLTGVALPPPGPVSDQALDALAADGTSVVILDPAALTADPTLRATPGARTDLPQTAAGPMTGLVVDTGLSALLQPAPGQSARLAQQRWLVETALIAAEAPNDGRTLLVVPPRRGSLDPDVVGPALLDTGRLPWMCGVDLADVVAGTESCVGAAPADHSADRGGRLVSANSSSGLPPALRPLSPAVTATATQLHDRSAQFTGAVLTGGNDQAAATRRRLQRALLRTVSSAWREQPAGAARSADALRRTIDGLFDRVVLRTGKVLLTSKSSKLQVAVINELDQPVRVQVRLTAPSSAQLSTNGPAVVELAARETFPVVFDAETLTSGRFVVRAELLDQNGVPFGTPQQMRVRSTRYGSIALAVTGIAAAVLLVAAGVRITRRALGRGHRGQGGQGGRRRPGGAPPATLPT